MTQEEIDRYKLGIEIEERKLKGEDVKWEYSWGYVWQEAEKHNNAIDCAYRQDRLRIRPEITPQEKWVKDGKKVQYKFIYTTNYWHDFEKEPITFDAKGMEWRIKPEKKRAPLTREFFRNKAVTLRNKHDPEYEFLHWESCDNKLEHYVDDYEMWDGAKWVGCYQEVE